MNVAVYLGSRSGDSPAYQQNAEVKFRSILDSGRDVLYIGFSSGLSGTYEAMSNILEMLRPAYPDRKILHVDTLAASMGEGLLVYKAAQMAEGGATIEETCDWVRDKRLNLAHWFTVDDLVYLKRGGRVSNASAMIGSMLSIKPVLYVPDGGTLDVAKKVRGRKAAIQTILDGVLGDLSRIDPTGLKIHILQADCRGDAEILRDGIKAAYPQVGEITITGLGVVIGAHCGPGLLTIFYLCRDRQPE